MTVKEELHDLVDQIAEDEARQVLDFLRDVVLDAGKGHRRWSKARRMGPLATGGDSFVSGAAPDLAMLAADQGVGPVTDLGELRGDFWPDDERVDDFVEAVRAWRWEGTRG